MLKDLCSNISQNKNLLMFLTVSVYILALFATLSGLSQIFAIIFSILLLTALFTDLFPSKYILVWAFIFYLGIFNTSSRLKNTDDLLNLAPQNSTIYGKVLSIPENKGKDKTKFFFRIDKIEYDNEVQEFKDEKTLVTLNSLDKLKLYDNYKITGRLSTPFKAGNPSQFDYSNYLRNFATYSVFYGKTYEKFDGEITAKEKLLQKINNHREKIIDLHSNFLTSPNLEILGGIVFGDDAVSPPENIKKSFINSGLLHILAASGMNVAFIFSFFYFFLSLFRINYKANILFCMLMVLVYSLMTGLGPSVIRATFMLVFVLLGKLIDRDAHSVSLLAFVAFLMLLYNPMYINDVGFQLSFVVTFGLLVTTPFIVRSKNRFLNWILGTISIPIIAQLWVIPIQIFYFNNISLYSVFANIMSVPILSVISFGGFVSSLVAPITPIFVCKLFDTILNPLLTFLVWISDFWGGLPHASCQTTHPSIFQILVYYLILLLITALLNKEIREKYSRTLKITLASFILILLVSIIPIKNHNLEIMAFDVGNADSFLIKTPENKYIMIDTAKSGYNGGKSQAEMLILKYMLDRGIKELDTLIVTHFDNDHCGGAVDLMNELRVKNLYVNSINHPSVAAKEIYETADVHDVNLILAENNKTIYDSNGLVLKNFIAPDSLEVGDNEASILTLLSYKDFSMLFTGDAGIETFNRLKQYLPKNITVLKVGHHGALGVVNKEMINYLNPKISLISVGENKFGHPTTYTLNILKHTQILRTDINNSVKFVINNKNFQIYTFNIKKKKYQLKNSQTA